MYIRRGKSVFKRKETFEVDNLIELSILPWLKKFYHHAYIEEGKIGISPSYIASKFPEYNMSYHGTTSVNYVDEAFRMLKEDIEFILSVFDEKEPDFKGKFKDVAQILNFPSSTISDDIENELLWDDYLILMHRYETKRDAALKKIGEILPYLNW